jgi:UDP-glucose 4-epimerase
MLFNDRSGAYNLGADGTVTLAEVGRRLGRRLVRVPRAIMKAMAELGWRLRLRGLSESNGAVVDFLCYVPVLDNAKIKREAGFSFRYTSSEAINDYLASRNSAVGTGRAGAT